MKSEACTLRVGIVGAGQISEFHLRALARVRQAKVVAVVDTDRDRAESVARKWSIPRAETELSRLFDGGVDVVHVLTPPSTHAAVTLEALARGCHVYVEKPLATSREDCDRIVAAAREAQREICVGHSFLRDPTLRRACRVVESGAVGDVLAVHYVRATVYPKYRGGPIPEMFRDGGYPFRDMGVHGLYIVESLLGRIRDAKAAIGSTGLDPTLHCDEWTAVLDCERGQATVRLSWNSRPQQHAVVIEGTRGVVRADLYAMNVTLKRTRRIPEHANRVVNAVVEASQTAFGTVRGLAGFLLGRVRQYHGVQALVEEFYRNLLAGKPSPVTPDAAGSVVEWTEAVAREGDLSKQRYLARQCAAPQAPTLVTGGTGLIGRRLVRRLLDEGRPVRLLVRRIPEDPALRDNPQVELILGDLGDPQAVDRAVAGVSRVFHLGAALRGTREEFDRGTIVGTRNVVDAALRHKVSQLVYVSSLSVLHALAAGEGDVITEEWPLEPHADWRGHYSRTKLEAELLVRQAIRDNGLPAVILRPAEVLGEEGPRLTAGIGLQFGSVVAVLGKGKAEVPLVHVDDVVDALLAAERLEIRDGSIIHLVDPAQVTQEELLNRIRATRSERLRVIHLPIRLVRTAGRLGDALGALLSRRLPISSYRLNSATGTRRFGSGVADRVLGWKPKVGVQKAIYEA